MNIKEISFGNFKSLYNTSFEPGKVNVFVGANGPGSLQYWGQGIIKGAAMIVWVDASSLQRKGVRLSTPSLYKSRFKSIGRTKLTVALSLEWEEEEKGDIFKYDVHLTTPTDTDYGSYAECLSQNGEKKWGRRMHPNQGNNYIGFFLIDENPELVKGRDIAKYFSNYGIYQPNTLALRGTIPDPNQTVPVGLNGGRLAEALQDIMKEQDGDIRFGSLYMDDVLEMIDWPSDITIDIPKKTSINSNIPTTRQVIEFTDRFMNKTAKFTGYDASEGALYVLFMLCLAMHQGSVHFCIDSFDHVLNPRLLKKSHRYFVKRLLRIKNTFFLLHITHLSWMGLI